MAQIPSDIGLPTVRPSEAVPDVSFRPDMSGLYPKVSPLMFGGGTAAGLQAIGQGASKANIEFGQIAADDMANQFQDQANKLLHGDPTKTVTNADGTTTPDTGYLGLKGRAALDQRADYEKRLDQLLKDARSKLYSPRMQEQFDTFSRRYRAVISSQIGTHADTQANAYGMEVNKASVLTNLNTITANADNPELVAHSASEVINGYTKMAELQGAQPGDPIWNAAVAQGKAAAARAQILSIAGNDPLRAQRMVENYKDVLGKDYSILSDHLRERADTAIGRNASDTAITNATSGVYVPKDGAPVTPTLVHNAIVGQESGGRQYDASGKLLVSVNGAVGAGQMLPATFQRFALPGEKISNRDDNLAVSRRAIDYYYQKYNGDWSRVAVAYFSGDGNVAPAGAPTPWVSDFKDGNGKSTSSYVADIGAKLNVVSPQQARANAINAIMTNDQLTDAQKHKAVTDIEFKYHASEVASMADAKAKKEQNDAAADEYVKLMGNAPPDVVDKIRNDGRITDWHTREHLINLFKKDAGEDDIASYGSGYADAYRRIMLPPGTEGRITDNNEILQMGAPGGTLSAKGVGRLMGVMNAARRDVDQAGLHSSKAALLAYAKSKLSFEQDMGPVRIRDPKGEAIFNSEFVPKFEAAYDAWTKAGKDPYQFLSRENIDKMLTGMRSPAEMAREKVMASGEAAPAAPREPIPAPPDPNMSKDAWTTLVGNPPIVASGKEWPISNWAQVINWLRANPTPENKAAFDKKFAESGYTADDVLNRLKPITKEDQEKAQQTMEGIAATRGF